MSTPETNPNLAHPPLQAGEIVYLASGSPPMTILTIVGAKAAAAWEGPDGPDLDVFPLVTLRRERPANNDEHEAPWTEAAS